MSDYSYLKAAAAAILAAGGTWYGFESPPASNLVRDVADSLAGVTGTLAGFMLTCISIVIAVTPGDRAMRELKRIGTLGRLVRRSGWSVLVLIVASLLASITRLADDVPLRVLATATSGVSVCGLALLVASGREYLRVFGYLSSGRD